MVRILFGSGHPERGTGSHGGRKQTLTKHTVSPAALGVLFDGVLLSDIRYSVRKFARSPGLSFALLFTIALGIGSNVAVHRFVVGLTRPESPLTSVERIVSVFQRDAHREAGPLSYQDYLSLPHDIFEWLGAARISPANIAIDHHSEILSVASVTPALASQLSLHLDSGVVISSRLSQNGFRGQPGEHLLIDGVDLRVAGVASELLEGVYRGRPLDVWMPLQNLEAADRGIRNLWVLGRLRRAVPIQRRRRLLAGTFASLLLSRALTRITPASGLPPLWVWLAAPLVLAGAVAIASVLPARRASIVNPVTIMSDGN